MFKALPLAVIITSCHYFSHAQSSSTSMGARASGMAYASSCLSDEWSVFNNVAGLASVQSAISSFSCDVQPRFKPFNKAAAVFACPLRPGVVGLGIYRFGDDLYNEQIIAAGFSNQFGLAALGLKINYIQYTADGFGRKGMFTFSFGGIAELTPQFFIGAHIININQPKLSSPSDEKIPTVLIAGILFKPSDNTIVTTELEKDMDYRPSWKTGIEQKVHKKFLCRTGFMLYPASGFIGIGFKSKKISLDYTYQYSPEVGVRLQGSVSYKFNDVKKR